MIFNRLNKYQKNYTYLVGILKDSHVDTEEKVNAQIKQVLIRAILLSAATIVIAIVLYVLAKPYIPLWNILTLLVLAWAWASAISAIKIMKQYIAEELTR